jgi:threonyl-tRNA synthetase
VLVEHFAGAFPTWLAPTQVAIIPIADRHLDYARRVHARLKQEKVRSEVDESDNTMRAKIRHHQLQKVPYMLIVGDNEADSDTLSVRRRPGEETRDVALEDFVLKLSDEIATRSVDLSV